MILIFVILGILLTAWLVPIIVWGFTWTELITLAYAEKTSSIAFDFLEKIGHPLQVDEFYHLVNERIGSSLGIIIVLAIITILIWFIWEHTPKDDKEDKNNNIAYTNKKNKKKEKITYRKIF